MERSKFINIQGNTMISICVPTYNRPNLLSQLLDSILVQSYTDYEIIITDNSDNDETAKLIQNKFDNNKIKYYKNEKNLGLNLNVIKNFSLANGEYLTFTPDDDLWIDRDKLKKQVDFLENNKQINLIYSNAISIDYEGEELSSFSSIYDSNQEIINGDELLPGNNTNYFLMIATAMFRAKYKNIMLESFAFGSEEYFCYFMASTNNKIGFIYDKTVALREAEHYRTAVEDGKIVDWKKRKDIRIRQMFNIYNTLTTLHPESKEKLETSQVQNFLARHLISQAKASKSIPLLLQTVMACSLFFRKFSLIDVLRLKSKGGKSFG